MLYFLRNSLLVSLATVLITTVSMMIDRITIEEFFRYLSRGFGKWLFMSKVR